ncbi:MAG: endolytic transglycosylase MltG, partial [Candidatus Dormibacteraceae bacterium]
DLPTVCQILYNRLGVHMPLGSDASVLYALGRTGGGLTEQDLKVDSPYNTRLYPGLPPGPITSPSQSSIRACASPPNNDYIFFFSDPHGVTHFATTTREFLRQQSQYGVANTGR